MSPVNEVCCHREHERRDEPADPGVAAHEPIEVLGLGVPEDANGAALLEAHGGEGRAAG